MEINVGLDLDGGGVKGKFRSHLWMEVDRLEASTLKLHHRLEPLTVLHLNENLTLEATGIDSNHPSTLDLSFMKYL